MRNTINRIGVCILLLLASSNEVLAQLDPSNPPEPYIYYKVKVSSNPKEAANSRGTGSYVEGTQVRISTSLRDYIYQFEYWTLNGEKFSEEMSFDYMVGAADVEFIAHYRMNPDSPAEPESKIQRRLFLDCYPANSATFNLASGIRMDVGKDRYLCAYGNKGYQFTGWYDGEDLISNQAGFYYHMTDKETTLTAHFELKPINPDDPSNFYSTSCIINVMANDASRGTVNIDGLVEGRAVYDRYITISATPQDGYNFFGWSDGMNIVSTEASFTFMVTEAKDYTAMFLKNGYMLRYLLNGNQYASYVMEPGTAITPLDNPAKDGYEFFGWSEIPATMPSQEWTVNGYLYQMGDINMDDRVDKEDLLQLVGIMDKHINANELTLKIANINRDEVLNISDLTALVRLLMTGK